MAPVYRIEHGWLVQDHGECICNGPSSGVSSHEPGCGMEPLVYLKDLPGWPGERPTIPDDRLAMYRNWARGKDSYARPHPYTDLEVALCRALDDVLSRAWPQESTTTPTPTEEQP